MLARALNFTFIDLDDQIEHLAGLSIPAIFKEQGETGFRKLERKALQATARVSDAVISTGGGTPCFFDNLDWMNQHGLTLFLDVPTDHLFERLKEQRNGRPLLMGKESEVELKSFIHHKLEERLPYYRQAHISVLADSPPEQLVQRILAAWKNITGH